MLNLTVNVTQEVPVKYLHAEMGVRYWEDAKVNGEEDSEDAPRIPLKRGDTWEITVDLETGVIANWPEGVTADTHYKVCDDGIYRVLKEDGTVAVERDGYVPAMLSPGGNGYGDYVIMKIDGNGKIENWRADLEYFGPDFEKY